MGQTNFNKSAMTLKLISCDKVGLWQRYVIIQYKLKRANQHWKDQKKQQIV